MNRTTQSPSNKSKHKKILNQVKGFSMRRRRTLKCAKEALRHAKSDKTISRKLIKRNMRRLWIIRLNAFARCYNLKYSQLMNLVNSNSPFTFDRKVLSYIVFFNPELIVPLLNDTNNKL